MTEQSKQKAYKCERCGLDITTKGNYVAHLKINTPCEEKLSNVTRESLLGNLKRPAPKGDQVECKYCKKNVSKSNLKRHIGKCKERPTSSTSQQDTSSNTSDIASSSVSTTVNSPEFMNMMKEVLKVVIKELLPKNVTNMVTNNYNINNGIQIVNPYGSEDMSHITPEFLSCCLLNPTKGITTLIDNIHYNKDKPCNWNIRYKSKKQKTFEKYIDSQWLECDASNTLDELIRKGYRVLNQHYIQHFMENPEYQEDEIKRQLVEKFRFLCDRTSNEYYAAKRDLRVLIKNRTLYVVAPPTNNGDETPISHNPSNEQDGDNDNQGDSSDDEGDV